MLGSKEILNLAEMLQPAEETAENESQVSTAPACLGPGDIGPPRADTPPEKAGQAKESKNIWCEDEVANGAAYEDIYDPRPTPEYDIIYKQAVRSEDMFLQMGNKTPSTASCEDMLVKIKLPDTKIEDVKLDVKNKFLDCRTPKYKLGLHLPHPVDSQNGRAQWHADQATLTVTLNMSREYDFMNF